MRMTLKRALARFRAEERGTGSVEAVLILPILLWAYVAMFVFFDGFRMQNTNLKAAYTVSDLISRETVEITPAYIDGMNGIFAYLADGVVNPEIRVTMVWWDDPAGVYRVDWSYATGSKPRITESDLVAATDQLPNLVNNERVIVVETWSDYAPGFDVGLNEVTFTNFIVTSPRFAPKISCKDCTPST